MNRLTEAGATLAVSAVAVIGAHAVLHTIDPADQVAAVEACADTLGSQAGDDPLSPACNRKEFTAAFQHGYQLILPGQSPEDIYAHPSGEAFSNRYLPRAREDDRSHNDIQNLEILLGGASLGFLALVARSAKVDFIRTRKGTNISRPTDITVAETV